MNDHLLRIMTRDGALRASAALTTGVVAESCRRQGTDPTASVALGRLVSGTALLGSLLKGEERLAVQIEGNGPLRKLQAETDAHGSLRATIKNPISGLPPRNDAFDVAGAIGHAGFLHVVKDLGMKEPYRGMVQLQSSEVGEDLAWYLTTSEQVPSLVALGVRLDREAGIAAAGGILIQALPGAAPEQIALLEERLLALPPLSSLLYEGGTPLTLLERLFAGIPFSEQARVPLAFRCSCSRKQAERILATLGREELLTLATRDEATVVTCEYCRESYGFAGAALSALAAAG